MTRDERIKAAAAEVARAWADDAPGPLTPDNIIAVLDAALADVGGLDGLANLFGVIRDPEAYYPQSDFDVLRADRDRLREALMFAARGDDSNSTASKAWLAARLRSVAERAREALRDSEAGTKC